MKTTAIELDWADGQFLFDLKIGPVRAIEEKCNAGIGEVMARLSTVAGEVAGYRFRMDDYRETIMQGLIGGGMKQSDAAALVVKWVDGNPGAYHAFTAIQIISAWWFGVKEATKAGKSQASKGTKKADASPSAQSMAMAS